PRATLRMRKRQAARCTRARERSGLRSKSLADGEDEEVLVQGRRNASHPEDASRAAGIILEAAIALGRGGETAP
ncbi:MAG: hypothetical protein OXC54_09080, partial [Rhodospirillaceae bacterium]|nr:hypothetical protein [Rhodospirillaceae bacterium]